ncbi:hypothetical protein BGW36DRAFT_378665 [Talaromyces proteolyticus]|uniref:Uncharacterized protein n=1 Tax=Talaromyces proteolyticus TaxID=1131652 RepID=A0AAD4KR21_9EURO|nr:uncharacterized protein BGW36DRAFT_378665 [Talaromyces proteolyticus]KAH8697415.1 hypothetical protein BGW36DRAFT_378665 [Talaromyces proteolyticus]
MQPGAMRGLNIRPHRALRAKSSICQFCQFSSRPAVSASKFRSEPSRKIGNNLIRRSYAKRTVPSAHNANQSTASELPVHAHPVLWDLQESFRAIEESDKAVPEETVVKLLQTCLHTVESLANPKEQHDKESSNATSSLLDLAEQAESYTSTVDKSKQLKFTDTISSIVDKVLLDEKVFITTDILKLYTKIQTISNRPDRFPQIFTLFANKPIPLADTLPVQFSKQNPKDVKNAVPSELANMALDVAVAQRNLPLALAIIDTTFCAPAFYRAKVFKKAAAPLTGLVTAPVASYAVATWAAGIQNTMDPGTATGIAFAATLAYVGFTSAVGVIAIATSNDQMERVVWASGIPLRYRWLREEERAALDKVAIAWGFKDVWRRGEEEGEEWDNLREFIGMRGMILDKTELMEGMQ